MSIGGKLILIIGPSGVGKGTVIKELKKKFSHFLFPISCTTREKRPNEKHGEVYHFVSETEFQIGIKEGKFLEYAIVHKDHYYGTLKDPIMKALNEGKTVLRELDIQGLKSIKAQIPKKNLLSIFIYVKDWQTLKNRILKRHQETKDELENRRKSFNWEMKERHLCDYQVESKEGKIPEAVKKTVEIIERNIKRSSKSQILNSLLRS